MDRQYLNSVNLKEKEAFPLLIMDGKEKQIHPRLPGWKIWHWHEDFQFVWILEGTMMVHTLQRSVSLKTGQGVFFNRNVVHFLEPSRDCHYKSLLFPKRMVCFYPGSPAARAVERIAQSQTIECLMLSLDSEWQREILTRLQKLASLSSREARIKNETQKPVIKEKTTKSLKTLHDQTKQIMQGEKEREESEKEIEERRLEEIEKENSGRPISAEDSIFDADLVAYEILTELSRLWLVLMKSCPLPAANRPDESGARMRLFLAYIEEHYTQTISLEDLARSASVSKSECLRCFKTHLQTTPWRYLMDYRLQKAAELLESTDWSIARISEAVGISSQSHFGKLFKEKTGLSPLKFRNHQRNNKE